MLTTVMDTPFWTARLSEPSLIVNAPLLLELSHWPVHSPLLELPMSRPVSVTRSPETAATFRSRTLVLAGTGIAVLARTLTSQRASAHAATFAPSAADGAADGVADGVADGAEVAVAVGAPDCCPGPLADGGDSAVPRPGVDESHPATASSTPAAASRQPRRYRPGVSAAPGAGATRPDHLPVIRLLTAIIRPTGPSTGATPPVLHQV